MMTLLSMYSFPEQQNTETAEDLAFNFAVTNNSPDVKISSPNAPHGSTDTFYGTCIFRQEFDHSMKRSFNQRTLVMISQHNFPSFNNRLLQKMTQSGVISDPTTLQAAYNQMFAWRPPRVGRHELSFLGSVVTLDIAPHRSFPLQGLAGPTPLISDSPSSIYAYEPIGSWDNIMHFMPCITDLYVLYEKLVLCESIIVVAKSPQLASEAISSLLDLICPVPYAGVVKPYMTMQADFKSIGIDGGTPQPFIVGITNPFLLKRIIAAAESSHRMRPHILYLQNFDGPVPTRRHHSIHHKSSRNALLDLPGGGIEVHTPSKRFLKSDPIVLTQIEALLKLGDQTRDIGPIIRRHFADLTAQFVQRGHAGRESPLRELQHPRVLGQREQVRDEREISRPGTNTAASRERRVIRGVLQFAKFLLVVGDEDVVGEGGVDWDGSGDCVRDGRGWTQRLWGHMVGKELGSGEMDLMGKWTDRLLSLSRCRAEWFFAG
jgi:hypothetical protein